MRGRRAGGRRGDEGKTEQTSGPGGGGWVGGGNNGTPAPSTHKHTHLPPSASWLEGNWVLPLWPCSPRACSFAAGILRLQMGLPVVGWGGRGGEVESVCPLHCLVQAVNRWMDDRKQTILIGRGHFGPPPFQAFAGEILITGLLL